MGVSLRPITVSNRAQVNSDVQKELGGLELIATETIAGAAAQNFTSQTGLDLDGEGALRIIGCQYNSAAGASALSLYVNTDTTATNYYNQTCKADNAAVSGARTNTGIVCNTAASNESFFDILIWGRGPNSGYPSATGYIAQDIGSAMESVVLIWSSVVDANVTSVQLNSSLAASVGIGSYVRYYKEKI